MKDDLMKNSQEKQPGKTARKDSWSKLGMAVVGIGSTRAVYRQHRRRHRFWLLCGDSSGYFSQVKTMHDKPAYVLTQSKVLRLDNCLHCIVPPYMYGKLFFAIVTHATAVTDVCCDLTL